MIAVLEHDGYVYNENGLDIAALEKYVYNNDKNPTRGVLGFPGAQREVCVAYPVLSCVLLCVCVCVCAQREVRVPCLELCVSLSSLCYLCLSSLVTT